MNSLALSKTGEGLHYDVAAAGCDEPSFDVFELPSRFYFAVPWMLACSNDVNIVRLLVYVHVLVPV